MEEERRNYTRNYKLKKTSAIFRVAKTIVLGLGCTFGWWNYGGNAGRGLLERSDNDFLRDRAYIEGTYVVGSKVLFLDLGTSYKHIHLVIILLSHMLEVCSFLFLGGFFLFIYYYLFWERKPKREQACGGEAEG